MSKNESNSTPTPIMATFLGIVLATIFSILVGGLIINLAWAALMPALFPGLVKSGAISAVISYGNAMLLYVLIDLLTGGKSPVKSDS